MNLNAFTVLIVISLVLAVCSLIRPAWPLLPVAVILIGAALLVSRS